ncbi:hypothetical protein [Planotetraspora sp. GP83]|uniref:hypothetical protein n=1 Tax=Planotetraspora sp. GP83 TaxID=3156264 RepID=UPI00351861B4
MRKGRPPDAGGGRSDVRGFFASSAGREVTGPNRFIAILWLGAASLAVGVIALGVGLLTA